MSPFENIAHTLATRSVPTLRRAAGRTHHQCPYKQGVVTPRNLEVLAFMREFFAENDQLPSPLSIARHFAWASSTSAQQHIDALAKFGYVERNAADNWRFKRTTTA